MKKQYLLLLHSKKRGGILLNNLLEGLSFLLSWNSMLYLLMGISIGLIFGAIPGIGGNLTLALLIPFVFNMDLVEGLVFLLSAHAVVATGGSVSAVLMNTPGSGMNAATTIDGFPMTKKGEGGRALGAALTASALGGSIGALVLLFFIPVMQKMAMSFRPPEIFMLTILGISFISVISSSEFKKGLLVGGVGLLLSFIGFDPIVGIVRFNLGSTYLVDGLQLVPVVVGLFAIPEVITLCLKGGTIAEAINVDDNVWKGVRDTFKYWWLVVRCSIIGAAVGAIPGLGGEIASFIAYGHGAQTSKHSKEFGKGTIEGVIAPEAANNAKEGGSLIPTLAFGIPGSSGMAIMLGAFVILGLVPGPTMMTEGLSTVYGMVVIIAVANIIAVLVALLFGKWIIKVAIIPAPILIPFVLCFAVLGSYSISNSIWNIFVAFIFGCLGYIMKELKYPRAVLILGFILGTLAERNLYLALKLYGINFFFRPITLILLLMTLFSIFGPFFSKLLFRGKKARKI